MAYALLCIKKFTSTQLPSIEIRFRIETWETVTKSQESSKRTTDLFTEKGGSPKNNSTKPFRDLILKEYTVLFFN